MLPKVLIRCFFPAKSSFIPYKCHFFPHWHIFPKTVTLSPKMPLFSPKIPISISSSHGGGTLHSKCNKFWVKLKETLWNVLKICLPLQKSVKMYQIWHYFSSNALKSNVGLQICLKKWGVTNNVYFWETSSTKCLFVFSFCAYQARITNKTWDHALLLTGLDLYTAPDSDLGKVKPVWTCTQCQKVI